MNKGRGYLWEPKGIEIRKVYKGGFRFFFSDTAFPELGVYIILKTFLNF